MLFLLSCVFFFLRLPHWLLFADDSPDDIFGPTFILCPTYLVLCMWMASGSTHSPSPSLPVRLLTSLIWASTSALSICDITACFYIQHPISKESSLRNKMCWRRGKQSILQGYPKSQEVKNSKGSGCPWNRSDSLEASTRPNKKF